ncbi:MAG: hypothetical protein ACYC61_10950 [Isosphaeraceae bacterium]
MSRHVSVALQSLGLILGLAGVAAAQDPPPLEAPSLEGPKADAGPAPAPVPTPSRAIGAAAKPNPAVKPAGPGLLRNGPARPATGAQATPRVVSQPVRPETRPMLAIPGVTAPAAHPSRTVPSPAAYPSRTVPSPAARPSGPPAALELDALPPAGLGSPSPGRADRDEPSPLDGPPLPEPIEVAPPRGGFAPSAGNAAQTVAPRSPGPATSNPGEPIPLTIEPMDGDLSPSSRSASARPGTARPGVTQPRDRASLDDLDRERNRVRSLVAPRARGGLLGRFFSPPAPLPPPRERERERERDEVRKDSGKPDRDIPADRDPEAAARRRIERQIHETLGEKLRWYEVRMTGRNVVIVAQPSRFWLRRSVRSTLENLPALQGYRSRIEIRD